MSDTIRWGCDNNGRHVLAAAVNARAYVVGDEIKFAFDGKPALRSLTTSTFFRPKRAEVGFICLQVPLSNRHYANRASLPLR
jgi:23S rRNA G2445 N2-methylase RlmL